MMLEDAKTHLEELIQILEKLPIGEQKSLINSDYLISLKAFQERFKLWTPNVYVYLEGGNIQGASADCSMHFNLFDDDNEKETPPEERGGESYFERKETWQWMIDSGHHDGSLKTIY